MDDKANQVYQFHKDFVTTTCSVGLLYFLHPKLEGQTSVGFYLFRNTVILQIRVQNLAQLLKYKHDG